MLKQFENRRKSLYGFVVVLFGACLLLVSVVPAQTSAVAQLTSRSITLSDSGVSGGSISSGLGSGTAVSYNSVFTTATTGVVQGIVVDFCSNSPILTDTCTAPTAFTVGGSPSVTVNSGLSGTWAASSLNSGRTLVLSNSSGGSISAGTTVNFTINNVTNPSALGTFYARFLTYTTTAGATGYTATVPGTYVDYGGVALSTANIITINARVQEAIQFCVSAAAPTANCGGVTTPALTLGHGTNNILDSSAVDTAAAYSQLSTNATNGAVVRMKNSNSCGGLSKDGGTTCPIPAVNSGAFAAASQETAGTAAFGVNVSNGSAVSGGSGTVTADANYNNPSFPAVTSWVGMDTTSATSVTSTYGDTVASSTAPVSNINNTYTFGATAANITPAGIYTADIALIATGTY